MLKRDREYTLDSEHSTCTRELFGTLPVTNTILYLDSLRAWVKNALARNAWVARTAT